MAEVVWIGAAQDVAQVDTITLSGTWAAGETVSVTCNNKTVTVTGGTSLDTASEYASALKEALTLTSSNPLSFPNTDMTINAGGRQYGEFYDFDATVEGAVVTLTSRVPGVPFTVSAAETSASGSITHSASATAATGKNWFNNADNWEGGSLPTDSDVIVFKNSSIDVLYGLANTIADLSLRIANSYTGHIGLMATNISQAGFPYPEYRQKKLDLPITASTGAQTHEIGDFSPTTSAQGRRYFDMGTNTTSDDVEVYVYDAASADTNGPAVQIAGGRGPLYFIAGGTVGIGIKEGDNNAYVKTLEINAGNSNARSPVVWVGEQAIYETAPTVRNSGGLLFSKKGASDLVYDLYGGNTHHQVQQGSASAATINVRPGAKLHAYGSVYTNLFVHGKGTLDASRADSLTVTNATIYRDGTILNPNDQVTWTNGIDFVGCNQQSATVVSKDSEKWTPSAI